MKTPKTTEEMIEEMKDEIQEHGDMHGVDCPVNMEDPDECDCEEMSFWGSQIEKYILKTYNQIHTQSALEAEGKKEKHEPHKDDKSWCYYCCGYNQACDSDATYHKRRIYYHGRRWDLGRNGNYYTNNLY